MRTDRQTDRQQTDEHTDKTRNTKKQKIHNFLNVFFEFVGLVFFAQRLAPSIHARRLSGTPIWRRSRTHRQDGERTGQTDGSIRRLLLGAYQAPSRRLAGAYQAPIRHISVAHPAPYHGQTETDESRANGRTDGQTDRQKTQKK